MPRKPDVHRPSGYRKPERTRARVIRSSYRWQQVRQIKLNRNPLCERCLSLGRTTPATEVHHVRPVADHPGLAYAMPNLLSLCRPCHQEIDSVGR